jgi:hypothetical protein
MLVKEIEIGGDLNTGDRNTGDLNTGYLNTGDRNTGDRNTGDLNTGNWNTGDLNTGDLNTGYLNTGDRNTGDRNTGNWNATNRSCGLFCSAEPNIIVFDVPTNMSMNEFLSKHPECRTLGEKLMYDDLFNYAEFSSIPGWTLEKCKELHGKFIKARATAKE